MRGARGSVLAIALLVIAALSATAVALANYLSTETRLMRYYLAKAQARAWAKAGAIIAMERLAMDATEASGQPASEPYDWLGDDWAYIPATQSGIWTLTLPLDSTLTIVITDEERKYDLNRVNASFLHELKLTATVAQTIQDYLDPPKPGEDDLTGTPPYAAKNERIVRFEEVQGIRGVTPAIAAVLQNSTTPMVSSTSQVNINTASLELLQALCQIGGKPGLASQIIAYRWDPDDQASVIDANRFTQLSPEPKVLGRALPDETKRALSELLMGPLGQQFGVQSQHFTIVVTAKMAQPSVQYQITAIVQRKASEEPLMKLNDNAEGTFRMLRWQEG